VGVAVISTGIAALAYSTTLLASLEGESVNTRFTIRGHAARPRNLVVVGVDSKTFDQLDLEWPFPRAEHAKLINDILAQHPKVISIDVQFSESSAYRDELPFVNAINNADGRIVFSTTETLRNGDSRFLGQLASKLIKAGLRMHIGAGNFLVDPDGVIRRLVYKLGGLDTFAVATAEVAIHHPVSPAQFRRHIVYIDFVGPANQFPYVSYSDVIQHKVPPDAFRNKIVVVGVVASSLQDIHATSTDTLMSGPEIQANAIETLLHGLPLLGAPTWLDVVLIVLLSCAVPLVCVPVGPIAAPLVAVVVGALFLVAAQLTFNGGTVVTVVYPMLGLVLSTGGTMAAGQWADRREQQRLRSLFAASAPGLVEKVLSPNGLLELEPTDIIAGYRFESPLGRGGMGVVYRATQLSLDRPVAIKLILPERSTDPAYRERFKLESRLAASIEHVNVIPVYEAGEIDGLLFIAMRLVDGIDLAKMLARRGAIGPRRINPFLAQLAAAIDAAHEHGLVHRDIKPANILLTVDQPEHLYLTDFGVAKRIGSASGATGTGQWIGTTEYLAPEQISGEQMDGAADIYATTCVLYHCLTGEVPFPRDNDAAQLWAHINAPPPAPSRIDDSLPTAIDAVIALGMAKNPKDRFASATELARAYSEALGNPPSDAPATAARPHRPPPTGGVTPTAISD
jgi:CHASE2 domain-containing sensor protein